MSNRDDILQILNNSGLVQNLNAVRNALLHNAIRILTDNTKEEKTSSLESLLLSVGPAAASAAMDYAIKDSKHRGTFKDVQWNGNLTHNIRIVNNAPMEEMGNFSNVLRQFLLPRYAYLDFDIITDPRHQVDNECGYPKFITPIMYRYMYDRDDMARRVVDLYADEIWASDPKVYDIEDDDVQTPFKDKWQELCDDYNILQYLYRIDKLAGIGHYGALLLGVDDGQDLETPIDEPELLAGLRRSVGKKQRNLLYLRPFDEYLSFIQAYETNVNDPRYGLPKFYNLVFLDMTIDAAGASIGTRLNRRVHWSRVVHVADNLMSSLVFGVPRQQPVFNRLLDLRKIKGGSAEMLWKGGFPGINFEIDPQFVADDPDFDKNAFREEVERYSNGLQRTLLTVGVKANSLAPQVADPSRHVAIQVQAIAAYMNCPNRIFMGAEEARLASAEEKLNWNKRLGRKIKTFVKPEVVRNLVDRLVAIGVMPPPQGGKYYVDWDDLNTVTDEDKANLALKWTQAMSQYVASGCIHFMGPKDYAVTIMGLKPSDAQKCMDWMDKNGGLAKLLKVDPSQGTGVNGKKQNIAGQDKSENSGGDKERNTADKQIEGKSS